MGPAPSPVHAPTSLRELPTSRIFRLIGRLTGGGAGSTIFALLLFAVGCGSPNRKATYSPHENVLSIASEFALLTAIDPYKENPGKDLTGQSIAHATLVRLANYKGLHPGLYEPEMAMLRGRAYELLGDFDAARESYDEAASSAPELKAEAEARLDGLDQLATIRGLVATGTDLDEMLRSLEHQAREFDALAASLPSPFQKALARAESEACSVTRAELMATNRLLLPDGENQARRALEKLVEDHRESRRAAEHVLRLAHYHRTLAEEEARLHPPEQIGFSPERFRAHYNAAQDLLYRLSQDDGKPERLLARRELESLLAYGEYMSKRAQ